MTLYLNLKMMQEEGDNQMMNQSAAPSRFSLSLEKPQIIWSNSMDIIGIFSAPDRVIELHRVGYKHQKVFAKEDLVGPTAMAFNESTSSHMNIFLLAVGYEDGKVVLINAATETAEELFTTKISDFGAPITAMHWVTMSTPSKSASSTPISDFTKHIKSITSLDPAKMKPDVLQRMALLS